MKKYNSLHEFTQCVSFLNKKCFNLCNTYKTLNEWTVCCMVEACTDWQVLQARFCMAEAHYGRGVPSSYERD